MSKKIIFLLSSVILLTVSCKELITTKRYVNEELKEFLDFKPGSYWIYRDTATGKLDSMYIANYYSAVSEVSDEKVKNIYEQIHYEQRWGKKTIGVSFDLPPNENETKYHYVNYTGTEGPGKYFFGWSDENGFPETNNNIPHLKIEYLPLLNVYNTTYSDVIKSESVGLGDEFLNACYLKRNVGIVKFEFADSAVYELIRYNIVQYNSLPE